MSSIPVHDHHGPVKVTKNGRIIITALTLGTTDDDIETEEK